MKKVLVPIAPGCEELESVTIIDLLRRGGVKVTVASLDNVPVVASRGVILTADTTLAQAIASDGFDMVVVPGGMQGVTRLADTEWFIDYLKTVHASNRLIGAICAGPLAVGKAGLLDGRVYTAYPGVIETAQFPGSTYSGKAVEIDGLLVTSRGPGTAMDFALTLIELLVDISTRDKVETELVRT